MSVTQHLPVSLIRPAIRGEIPEIASLISAAFEQFEGKAPAAVLKRYIENSCNVGGRWDEGHLMVLASEGRIAATVTYYADAARENLGLPEGWAGFRTLAVHPSARNRGFGRDLVNWCTLRARIEGSRTIGIHTAAFMKVACGLYERTGFQRCPEYDLRASDILGLDPAQGDELVIAYRLQLRGVPLERNGPGLRNDIAGDRRGAIQHKSLETRPWQC